MKLNSNVQHVCICTWQHSKCCTTISVESRPNVQVCICKNWMWQVCQNMVWLCQTFEVQMWNCLFWFLSAFSIFWYRSKSHRTELLSFDNFWSYRSQMRIVICLSEIKLSSCWTSQLPRFLQLPKLLEKQYLLNLSQMSTCSAFQRWRNMEGSKLSQALLDSILLYVPYHHGLHVRNSAKRSYRICPQRELEKKISSGGKKRPVPSNHVCPRWKPNRRVQGRLSEQRIYGYLRIIVCEICLNKVLEVVVKQQNERTDWTVAVESIHCHLTSCVADISSAMESPSRQ